MARLAKRHRQAIARGVRRYWRRVKKTSRERNVGIREARTIIKVARQEEQRKKRRVIEARGWSSPDPEGEAAFNLQDRDRMQPPPWRPRLYEQFKGYPSVTIRGYWEYRASPQSTAVSDTWERSFDPGETEDDFWSGYFEAVRDTHDEILEGMGGSAQYERFAIFVTRLS